MLLRIEGRLVQIAFLQGAKTELDIMPLMLQAADPHRLDAAAAHRGAEGRDRRGAQAQVWPLIEAGNGQAGDPRHLPARARRPRRTGSWKSSAHIGKIVLDTAALAAAPA